MRDNSTNYYDIAVAEIAPWSKQRLTYSSELKLKKGDIVIVPFGKKSVFGLVIYKTTKPSGLSSVKSVVSKTSKLPLKTVSFYKWLEQYYPSQGAGHIHRFLPSFLSDKDLREQGTERKQIQKTSLSVTPTTEQETAINKIEESKDKIIVLHGITGSGKTTVYAERIRSKLAEGKDVLVVVPEISLVSQAQAALDKLLPDVEKLPYHSSLKVSLKTKTWTEARAGKKAQLFIGTRSALFLPFSSLGLVVVDEAHEQSLKEDHESSHYHGLIVAAGLAKIHRSQLIIGSATPPIPETYLMIGKGAELVCIHKIAKETSQFDTQFTLIDTNKHRLNEGKLITKPLEESIQKTLKNGEQVLLFINKLGSAHIIQCSDCGWQATCPNCDTTYTYHHDTHNYKCTICGKTEKAYNSCQDCGGALKASSLAIKSASKEVERLFPTARVVRFDSTNRKSESITTLYKDVVDGKYDIIIGTQMMAKGFDFPKLATVGVINADTLMHLPDINAEEKLFAQILQVAGRVGRGHRSGAVYIQTRQPENKIFTLIKENDWHSLYEKEIIRRKKHNYPPSVHLAKITVSGSSELIAKNRARRISDQAKAYASTSSPFPAFYHKKNKKYYWQILCRSKHRSSILGLMQLKESYIDIDIDPVTLL